MREKKAKTADGSQPITDHGIGLACYTNGPDGGYRPTLQCLCGESFRAIAWEEVGSYFDDHLLEAASL